MRETKKRPGKTLDAYAAAGVNIDAGLEAVRRMRTYVHSTRTAQVITDIGAFGGLFQLPPGYRQPVLVASTDGVGTKVMLALHMRRFDTIGQDLVNHCVNDILVQGAKPLFFMDYFATAQLNPRRVAQIVKGLAQACRENGCALLGGETAEMPGLYQKADFDLAGTIVGVVEKAAIIDGESIRPHDVVLGLPSTGLHTNGYSLARKICFDQLKLQPRKYIPELGATIGKVLLSVHRSYLHVINTLRKKIPVKGLAHITGGGFVDNIPRILPANCQVVIWQGSWPILPIFQFLQKHGQISAATMYRTFNLGIGMVVIVAAADAAQAQRVLNHQGEKVYQLGEIVRGPKKVIFH